MNPRAFAMALAVGLMTSLQATSLAQEVQLPAARQKITTVSAVRARVGPEVSAQEITRLKLGTVVTAVGRSAEEFEIGGKRDYWYRVDLPDGGPAWIFGGLLADYDSTHQQQIFSRIIGERLKLESMSFEDGVDFYNFVSRILRQAKDKTTRGELELARLHAVDRAVSAIPTNQQERSPYRDFYNAHRSEIYYHELAGGWYVEPDQYWSLAMNHLGTAVGDRIAWDAAHAIRPGECEDDEVCQFLALHQTEGRYLSLYPKGMHVDEALQRIAEALSSEQLGETLRSQGGDQYLREARSELRKSLTELRGSVSKTSGTQRASILNQIDLLLSP